MLADIQACLNLIQSIYNICDEINSNQKAIRRLSGRVMIFKTFLEDLKNKLNIDSNTASLPKSFKMSIESLKSLLSEINQYILKLKSESSNSFFGSAKRMVINVAFRKNIKDELDDLKERLNAIGTTLIPSMAIYFEAERKLDSDEFSMQIESLTEEVMNDLSDLRGKTSPQ